ncbi:lumazine-binding protein [Mycolicibacterium fortuitum]|uniref:Rv0361 family membrane protein n=1 Tax=Mycolicibacterium fortuitum TaxID=1766 RepID=UPI001490632F|nr:lumazine-binding protein [Mycolicibacterium fortuitum]NOQ59714.1 nuclear transport factor 2 family protein [Mycolicibacterium fortuitum]WAY20245.1 nuclear transport factor 2 family protein [Mycolicibacterium fortuitum]
MAEETEEPQDRPTMAPFLGALGVIVLVVIVVVLLNVFGSDGRSEEQKVSLAAVGQNDALQRENFREFSDHTCVALRGTEADFLARQRDSVSKQGARYVDDVTSIQVEGDRATATVVYHFGNTPDTKVNTETSFLREDGQWRVCSSMGDSRP